MARRAKRVEYFTHRLRGANIILLSVLYIFIYHNNNNIHVHEWTERHSGEEGRQQCCCRSHFPRCTSIILRRENLTPIPATAATDFVYTATIYILYISSYKLCPFRIPTPVGQHDIIYYFIPVYTYTYRRILRRIIINDTHSSWTAVRGAVEVLVGI